MMKHLKKLTAIAIATLMAITCFLGYKQADAVEADGEAGHFYVTVEGSGGWDYDVKANPYNVISITESGTYTIFKYCDCDEDMVHEDYQIKIDGSITVTLTIKDVQISNTSNAAMYIDGNATVTLALEGDNVFDSSSSDSDNYHAGIEYNDATGSLTIKSDTNGSLTAIGGSWSAGIGSASAYSSSVYYSAKNINITSGFITAIGGMYGAGIGGGMKGTASNITISGGSITANGGRYAAGIGGGWYGDGNYINITGGFVCATGGDYGAGIGGGNEGNGTNITISGDIVTANAGAESAGIGGGLNGSGTYITISGGVVTAIGGGAASSSTSSISTVEMFSGIGGAGIGGGKNGNGTNITISGGAVTAIKGSTYADAQAIGKGFALISNYQQEITLDYEDGFYYRTVDETQRAPDFKSTTDSSVVDFTEYCVQIYDYNYHTDGHYIVVNDNNSSWSFDEVKKIISITNSDDFIISKVCSCNSVHSDYQIVVEKVEANIILDNVQINNTSGAAMSINGEADVTLVLVGDNSFDSSVDSSAGYYNQYAGIEFNDSASGSLTITAGTIDGSLTAIGGGRSPGIGGSGYNDYTKLTHSGNNITITGGTIVAMGGSNAAGIGGGERGDASNIKITGGTVTATGGDSGAGIGGGFTGNASYIEISGGTVFATGGDGGAGIGGGNASEALGYGNGYNIKITGGNVTATSGDGGAGIGGGAFGSGYDITISGGTVTAIGDVTDQSSADGIESGAGIGGGLGGDGFEIKITGGTVTATGEYGGAGIGSGGAYMGYAGNASNITISGGIVVAEGRYNAAGIGGGNTGTGFYITITGGDVTATGKNGAGIGGGYSASGSDIIISGGTVTATAENAAGIGGGYDGYGFSIKISDGTIIATSLYGAGIGGGDKGDGFDIEISGGNVTAIGRGGGAGIGGGGLGSGYEITITGGTVTAMGVLHQEYEIGAGIGDGYEGSGSNNIEISNGSVKASSISTMPTDDGSNNVYLVEIPYMSGIDSVMVDDTEYRRSGNHFSEYSEDYTDGTFYLYLTGEDHEITAGEDKYKVVWNDDGNEGEDPFTVKEYIEAPDVEFTATGEDSGTLSGVDETMEYSLDGGDEWISIEETDIYDDKTDITDVTTDGIQIIYIETETTVSYIQKIEVSQAEMPKAVDSVDCTDANNDGQIIGVDGTMEYRLSSVSEWTPISGEKVTGLSAGTYLVRTMASGEQLASSAVTVTINADNDSSVGTGIIEPGTDLGDSGAMPGDSTSGGTIGNDDNIGTVGGGTGSSSGTTDSESSNSDSSGSYGTGSTSSGSGSGSGTYDGTTLISSTGNQIIVNTSAGSITSKEEE